MRMVFVLVFVLGCTSRGLKRQIAFDQPVVMGKPSSIVHKDDRTVFLKSNRPVIVENPPTNGSLYQLDNPQNQFFTNKKRYRVGDFLTVVFPQEEKTEEEEVDEKDDVEAEELAEKEETKENDEKFEDLNSEIPTLEIEKILPKPLEKLVMQIVDIDQFGNILLSFRRSSKTRKQKKAIEILARLPHYHKRVNLASIAPQDLEDIRFTELDVNGQRESRSTMWQPEYTNMIENFESLPSFAEKRLEKKRRNLLSVRERLQDQLRNLGTRRREMAKQRDSLLRKNASQKKEIEEQRLQLEEQAKELEDLKRPEAKPGDGDV